MSAEQGSRRVQPSRSSRPPTPHPNRPAPPPQQQASSSRLPAEREREVQVIRTAAKPVAKRRAMGQGFEAITVGREQKILQNKAGGQGETSRSSYQQFLEHSPDEVKPTKILTAAAKERIFRAIAAGEYDQLINNREPPYMAPSVDPDEYSEVRCAWFLTLRDGPLMHLQWCSLCNDFPELLLLCAGCRVGVCMSDRGSKAGCLKWYPNATKQDNFIFYCPFCAIAAQTHFPVWRKLPFIMNTLTLVYM